MTRTSHAWLRNSLSFAVAAMGAIDVLSALLSRPSERLVALRRLVPTEILDTSRTFTLLAGILLLVTAWGLRRGKRRAFVTALFLCAVSVPVNVLKAFDFEEAVVAAGLMFVLGVSGHAFQVKSRALSFRALGSRTLVAALGLLIYALVGSWAIKFLYGVEPTVGRAFADAAWRMFGIGGPVRIVDVPMPMAQHRIVVWYLRSLPLLSFTLVIGFAIAALRPATHRRRHRAAVDRVRALIAAHGDSSVSAFTLEDDADHFFSANDRAVIAYRFESDTLLAIGDPIGPAEEIPGLLEDFARYCLDHDWQYAFFQARPDYLPHYRALGMRALHIGEDPVLWADRFTLDGGAVAEARRAVRKAEKAGIDVTHHFPDGAGNAPDPASDPALMSEVHAISNEWLAAHHGGEKGFCMGRFEPARLSDVWLVTARRGDTGRIEAFVTWVPIPARRGWALDLMRRRSDAPAGVMEMIVVRSVEAARARGDAMLSLSLSALASVDGPAAAPASAPGDDGAASDAATPPATSSASAPAEADRARAFLMEHLARYYDFKGLFRWKKKFDPAFEDRYLVYPGPLALPRVTLALIRAQSPGGLRSYLRAPGRPAEPAAPRTSA